MKEQEQKDLYKSIEALVNNMTSAYNVVKYNEKTIQDIIDLSIKYFTITKDFDKIYMLFYNVKVGKTTFYNKFLREYFAYNGVKIEYNIYKKKIFYFGNIKDIKKSYTDFKKEVKKDREEYIKSLSSEEKLKNKLSFIDKLSKDDLDFLLKYVKDKQHKSI